MNSVPPIMNGDTLVSYLPSSFSHEDKLSSIRLVEDVRRAITRKLPMSFIYHSIPRVVVPANLYLQNRTGTRITMITHPVLGYPKTMTAVDPGARRAIGFDVREILKKSEDQESWKTFHIDKIEHLRLLTIDEAERRFPHLGDDYMETPTEPLDGHVKNWNYWSRRFMAERDDGRYDLRA